MHSTAPLTVRLDAASKNLLSLLASSENRTIEEYAQNILREHAKGATSDDAIMATLGRALLSGRAEQPEPEPTPEAKPKPKPEAKPKAPDGTARCKDGKVMTSKELRAQTLSAHDVADYLGVSRALVIRCVNERGVVPYGSVNNSKRMPRFRDTEVLTVNEWLLTPDHRGISPRSKRCPKCGRYFSACGMRLHVSKCPGPPKL